MVDTHLFVARIKKRDNDHSVCEKRLNISAVSTGLNILLPQDAVTIGSDLCLRVRSAHTTAQALGNRQTQGSKHTLSV
jgi:hypothetical protein